MIKLKLPLNEKELLNLKCGDEVLLTGVIYTARDAAHKRLIEEINAGKEPPLNLRIPLFIMSDLPPQNRVRQSVPPDRLLVTGWTLMQSICLRKMLKYRLEKATEAKILKLN